jgi:hypothetical protein
MQRAASRSEGAREPPRPLRVAGRVAFLWWLTSRWRYHGCRLVRVTQVNLPEEEREE